MDNAGSLGRDLRLFWVGILIGVVAALIFASRKRKRAKPLTVFEYWIYLPGTEMPSQTEITRTTMLSPGMGHKEGLLFSDIRLHISLVLKDKNPHAFRPDLFERHITPTAEVLENLAKARAFIKARYISEIPIPDKRHVRFMPQLAKSIYELGDGAVVFDTTQEKLFTGTDFLNETTFRVFWADEVGGGRVETRGLAKIGLDEIVTEMISLDQRTLALEVIEGAAQRLWDGADPSNLEVECFDDSFRIELGDKARILRLQASSAGQVE